MLRIMTLTEPAKITGSTSTLAQKIIEAFRLQQEENRKFLLDNAFGGSFFPFLIGGIVFAAWQIFCAVNPSQAPAMGSLSDLTRSFLENNGEGFSWLSLQVFDWGQAFLLFLSFAMMGFVLRSHSGEIEGMRLAMLVLCGYVISGYIVFSGLGGNAASFAVMEADFVGNGSGAASYLLGTIPAGKTLGAFDIILLESGITGLAILAFLLFIPLGYIALSAHSQHCDKLVSATGMISGIALILSVFLPFTPALGGYMALCGMALFLAWGHVENRTANFKLTNTTI